MSCGAHCAGVEARFGEREATRELRSYRRKGPPATTRLLLGALRDAGVEGATLLDIGGGVGILQQELLEAGAARAVSVDASSTYLATARAEARRRGLEARTDYHHGNFVDLAGALPPCDVVTLDRVICCYPDMEALVRRSAAHAGRLWGAVYPRDRLVSRLGVALINLWERARGSTFRAFVHAPADIEAVLAEGGLRRRFRASTLVWEVGVWERPGATSPAPRSPAPS
ncbi:MAG TPA: methyltransferase domain-containing protein [Longimicrobiales bacterium]|nr:methyltransferase domain-containing protein [Longimicrobiales bacterium]